MKAIFLSLFMCSITIQVFTQHQVSGSIMSPDSRPIEYALVSLISIEDSLLVKGVVTDKHGVFIFPNASLGSYQIKVQMLGYKDQTQQIDLTKSITLAPIYLEVASKMLDEVQVTARQSLVESHLGKKVLYIGQDITAAGSNVLESLELIPSITTTPRGQVQIRGNSNVIIYINGKETRRNPSNLKYIDAALLEKIEIITNPSAEYDAEGVGGIINLVYKRNNISTHKVELISNLTQSTNPYDNIDFELGLNASVSKKNFTFFTNLSYDYGDYKSNFDTKRSNFKPTDGLLGYENLSSQQSIGKISNILVGGALEVDTTLSMALEVNYDQWDFLTDIQQQNIFTYQNTPSLRTQLPSTRKEIEQELWANFTLEKALNQVHVLKFAFTTGGENEDNFSQSDEMELPNWPDDAQQFLRSSDELERQRYYHIKFDYEAPFFSLGTIQAGIKADFIRYNIQQSITLLSNRMIPDNNFQMDMQKWGLYLLQKKQLKRLGYSIGLRLEQFSSDAFQESEQQAFTLDYLRLFPSIQLYYQFAGKEHSLGFNYTRRINRPSFFDLNPYISYEDPLNLETGNPALEPEIANLIEGSYHQEWNALSLDVSIYSRSTEDVIQTVIRPLGNNVSIASTANIGRANTRGVETQVEYRFNEHFKASGSLIGRQISFQDSQNEITYTQRATWSIRLRQQLNLNNNWRIELNEIYRAPSFQIQEKTLEVYYLNIGINKKTKNKRANFAFVINDLFNTRQDTYLFRNTDFAIERRYKWQTRQIRLNIKYLLVDQK